jgi:dipeptidyl aminopeptidase/acylaminoacyl peptidase
MTDDTFGRDLDLWLREDAAHRVPDHLGELLVRTTATRQRRWWSSPERWLPVDLTTRTSAFTQPRVGRALLIALLVLGLAVAALLAVGAQRSRVPPPFGPATNGTRLATADGDIYTLDPVTHERRPLITGPRYDFAAFWSRDGRRFVFLRADRKPAADDPAPSLTLAVAQSDGSNIREVVGPVHGLDWFDWSADGRHIAFLTPGATGKNGLNVVDVESGKITTLDLGFPAGGPTWRPPDGRELVFRQEGDTPGIYAVRPDGSGLRKVSTRPAISPFDFQGPALSPDGRTLAYTSWSESDSFRLYVLDVETGAERRLPMQAPGRQGWGVFSPDGRSIAYARAIGNEPTFDIVVAPADGLSEGRAIGAPLPLIDGNIQVQLAFTPDGSAVIARYGDDEHATASWLPLDGSRVTAMDTGAFEFVDVQRIAP